MPTWKVIAAKVTGPDHEEAGLPCQDAYGHLLKGTRLIAAVADGAGSARFSETGAQTLVDCVISELAQFDTPIESADWDGCDLWTEILEAAVERARTALTDIIAGMDCEPAAKLSDYHATMVGFIAEPEGGFFFHIGDGTAAAVPDVADWQSCTLSMPENGEFANETYFFTQDDWRDHLRITPFGPSAAIVAVSDGAMPFTVAQGFQGLEARFLAPVTAFLDKATPEAGGAALAGTLDRADARRISGDDKTFLWARLQADTPTEQ